MTDLLGEAFRMLAQFGGGSEMLPLLVFCILVVLLGLGLGLGVMRLFSRSRDDSEAEPDVSQ